MKIKLWLDMHEDLVRLQGKPKGLMCQEVCTVADI